MTTALATRDTQALAIPGMEGLTQADMKLPVYKIVQGQTRDAEMQDAGKFLDTISHATFTKLNVVILRIWRIRSYFYQVGDKSPVCSSKNGTTPIDAGIVVPVGKDNEYTIPETCMTCQLAMWDEDNHIKPVCAAGYMALCVDTQDDSMFLMRAMGMSAPAMKDVASAFGSKRKPPFSGMTTFTTELVTNDKGKFYVLRSKVAMFTDPQQIARWTAEYAAIAGVAVDEKVDTQDEATTETVELKF